MLFPMLNVYFVQGASQVVVKQAGLPGCENINTAQLEANLKSLKGTPAEGLGEGLNGPLVILRQFCPDDRSGTDFIVMILSFYGYMDEFMEYVALLVKIQQGIQLTVDEANRLVVLSNILGGISTKGEKGDDLFTVLNKYDGKAGELGGFCNVESFIGTCLYDMPTFSGSGSYLYNDYTNNIPGTLIDAQGHSTFNFCKVVMCGPKSSSTCVNGCSGGLVCCSANAGPDIGRYFKNQNENEPATTMVNDNFPSTSIGVLTPVSSTTTTSATAEACKNAGGECHPSNFLNGADLCNSNNICNTADDPCGGACGQSNYKSAWKLGDNGCSSLGADFICWGVTYKDGVTPNGGGIITTSSDGGLCPSNADGTISHTCYADYACHDTECCGYKPSDTKPCDCNCGENTVSIPAGNRCVCVTTNTNGGSGQNPSTCPDDQVNIGNACINKEGCIYGRSACNGCDVCDNVEYPQADGRIIYGKCTTKCTNPDLPACKQDGENYVCVEKQPCPYLYSVTEDGEKFENALIEIQYAPSMDYPYYAKLEWFDGKLKIKEHFEEVAYINSFKLFKVTHDKDEKVLMNGLGEVVTITNPQAVECKNKYGIECTDLIMSRDAPEDEAFLPYPGKLFSRESYGKHSYSTDISMVDLSNEETYKDYLELTLPESDSKIAKLVMVSSLTPNVAMFGPKFAKDHKKILPLIYASLEYPIFDDAVKKASESAGYIHVQIQDELGNWVDYSNDRNSVFVTNFVRESVVIMEREQIRNNKIRILFTSGAYAFDYISVDYSEDKNVIVEKLAPISVKDGDGMIIGELANYDSKYKKLKQNEEITIEFDKPNPDATYFAEVTGYYQPGDEVESSRLDIEQIKSGMSLIFRKNYAERYLIEMILDNN